MKPFKYTVLDHTGKKDRRYWRAVAKDLAKGAGNKTFTSAQVAKIILATVDTMSYEMERLGPQRELQALAKGTAYVKSELVKQYDAEGSDIFQVAELMVEISKRLMWTKEAFDKIEEYDQRKG